MNEEPDKPGYFIRLANWLRHWDRWLNGSHWRETTERDFERVWIGRLLLFVLRSRTRVDFVLRLVLPQGHAAMGLWLGFITMLVMVYGPTLSNRGPWGYLALVAALVMLAANYLLGRRDDGLYRGERLLFRVHIVVLLVVSLAVFMLAPATAREHHETLYLHVAIPVLLLILFTLGFSRWLAAVLFRGFDLADALSRTELFVKPAPRSDHWSEYLRGALVVPLRRPLELCLPAALWILMQADRTWMWIGTGVLLAASLLVLAAAEVMPRLREASDTFGRWFFIGVPRLVTMAVIAIALLRLLEVDYVTTLIEVAPHPSSTLLEWVAFLAPGINLILLVYVVITYLLFWFYSYWSNRFLTEQLLVMLGGKGKGLPRIGTIGQIDYVLAPHVNPATYGVRVLREDRKLQIHGASRFAVVGDIPREDGTLFEGFHFYDPVGLVQKLLNPRGESGTANAYQADRLRQRIQFHTYLPTTLLIGSIGLIAWLSWYLPQAPELVVEPEPVSVAGAQLSWGVNLEAALFGDLDACGAARGPGTPRILLAGSGGGTRAAVNTAAVLRALARAGHACNVVLLSGVSGSSAAIAYFAGHPELRAPDFDGDAWDRFADTMAASFIQDALEAVPEWRIASGVWADPRDYGLTGTGDPAGRRLLGYRMGHLLAESFERHFYQPETDDRARHDTLGDVENLGLIFNTTVTGSFPRGTAPADGLRDAHWQQVLDDKCRKSSDRPLPLFEAGCSKLRGAEGAGGRALISNLDPSLFEEAGPPAAPNEHLVQAVLGGAATPLTRAAALSANFPPVFSNAAIDRYFEQGSNRGIRLWVTDGGATDNRGLISLLQALEAVLSRRPPGTTPPIHVVVAEASATELAFSQDRGVGAGLGSKEKLAAALINRITCRIAARTGGVMAGAAPCVGGQTAAPSRGRSSVALHYLSLPTVLRDSGLGTHWMTPAWVRFERPPSVSLDDGDRADSVRLSGCRVRFLIESLYVPGPVGRDCRAPLERDGAGGPVHASADSGDVALLVRWIREDTFRDYCVVWKGIADALGFEPYCITAADAEPR